MRLCEGEVGKTYQVQSMKMAMQTERRLEALGLTPGGRIVVMNKGKVVLEGTPKEVFSQVDLLHSLRLDVPQATELAQQLRAAGLDMPKDCITEEECAQALAKLLA